MSTNCNNAAAIPQSKKRIATRYKFNQITTPFNTVYIHLKRESKAVQDIVATLCVLAHWEHTGFREYQGALSDHVTRVCEPARPYSKNQMNKGLARAKALRLIHIPNRMSRQEIEEKACKEYTFLPDMFKLLELPKLQIIPKSFEVDMWDTSIPSPKKQTTEKTSNTRPLFNPVIPCSNLNNSRTSTVVYKEQPKVCVESGKSQQGKKQYPKPPKNDLSAKEVLNQVVHWIPRCKMVKGKMEALALVGRLLDNLDDPQVEFWLKQWPEFSKSEKSFGIRSLIGVLRNFADSPPKARGPVKARAAARGEAKLNQILGEAEKNTAPPPEHALADFDIVKFKSALFFGEHYDGPGQAWITQFRKSDSQTQELLLLKLNCDLKQGKNPWQT